jgi:glycosyltransferase 2 family protein
MPAADPSPDAARLRRRRWSRLAGWAVSIAILAATAALLRDRFTAVGEAGGLPGIAPSLLAVLLFTAANAVLADTWRRMVALGGGRLSWGAGAWVWSVSQLARYTIGAAQIGGRAVMARRYGLTGTAGAVTALVEVGWQTSITAAMVLATLPWWLPGAGDLTWLAWVGVLPVLVLVWGLVAPQALLGAIAAVANVGPLRRVVGARIGRAADATALTRGAAAELTGRFALNSGLRLVAFLGLYAAVGGTLDAEGVLLATGASAVGQLVGRLAVFAPGGIGPREGATALVVAPVIGGGPALVLVAATRLLEVVAELAFFVIARATRPQRVDVAVGERA